LTFEDPRATTSDPAGSKYSTQEWIESVEQAREIALAQSAAGSYAGEINGMHSGMNSPVVEPLGNDSVMPMSGPSSSNHSGRQTLRKDKNDGEENKGRKRFSKRHSKSGLAAVF
jgi:3-phosphoinositide dependent protein kinase-1